MSEETESNNRMINPRGARWARADFHLHTIKERGASRKDYRAEFAGKEDEFPGAFVDKLEEREIRIAAITNHNTFDLDEYQRIARKARRKGILVLPGVELGMRGGNSTIHSLVIFNPENLSTDNDFISRFLNGVFPSGTPEEGSATTGDLADCISRLDALKESYFIVFAHVESDNGLLNDMTKTALKPIYELIGGETWERRVLGFQGVKSDLHWIEQKLPEGMPIPAFVEGSDPETSIEQIGREDHGKCFLKVSELSYHSVRFALRDHVLRVRHDTPLRHKSPRIQSIGIEGGRREVALYQLSENLNTLIGSRGSGKSLMIEALRWCLNLQLGEGDSQYKRDLIDAFLSQGATVRVKGITEDGKPFEVSRSYTGKKQQPEPQVTLDGELHNIDVETLLPGVLYFGQKDLGERGEEATDNIFDQLLPAVTEDLQTASLEAKSAFEKAIDTYVIAKKAQEKDDELKFEEKTLTEKLKTFKELGVEDRLKEITAFDQDLRRLRNLHKSIRGERSSLEEAFGDDEPLDSWEDILQSEHTEDLKPELAILHTSYETSLKSVSTGIEGLRSLEKGIAEIGTKLNAKLKEKQESFAEILREVNQPELDIDDYRKMVSRLEQIKETRAKTEEKKGKLGSFEQSVLQTGKAWHSSLEAITKFNQTHIAEINKRLPEAINIHQEFQGDEDGFRTFLGEIFSGSGFTATAHDALVASATHGLDLFERRRAFIDTELTDKMAEKFAAKLEAHFTEILTFSPQDLRMIEYGGTLISELSLGKRAMALLLLLLSLDTHPIIILDQPEDDLDNETIHSYIVKPLIENKDRIQFVIATHNPNIPVLGDAEQVIACYEETKGHYREDFGSLDMTETKDAIIDIMEGGPQAFEKRHDIYTLWAKPH